MVAACPLRDEPEVGDEIYIQAKWIDGDGATINSRSNEVSGNF